MESRKRPKRDGKSSSMKKKLDKLAEDIKKLPPERIESLQKVVRALEKKCVSIIEAAEIMDCSKDTIRRAIKSGSLKAFQINEFGTWKISMEEIERFMRGKE